MKEKLDAVERRLFRRSSEKGKTGKMPPPVKKARTAAEAKTARQELAALRNAKLKTEITPVDVPASSRSCPKCDNANLSPVGAGKPSTVIEFVPGYFRKRIHLRETLACTCGEYIVTAPPPPRVGSHTLYAPSFVAHVVVSKCADCGPHYRLAKGYARIGIPISRSTIGDLFHRAAKELRPLWIRLLTLVAASPIVFADETTMKVLETDSKAWVWTFLTDKLIGYKFAMSRSGATPLKVLGETAGHLVCDAYTGYNKVSVPGRRVRAGCLAHARRKIFEAGALPEAAAGLELISAIYTVEHEAKAAAVLGTAAHLALRKQRSRPLFAQLLLWARAHRRAHGPKTPLGKASGYILNNRKALSRFLNAAELPPDNNRAEAALRRVAQGRKVFLFVGNEAAGENLAILYSLVASCENLGLNPVDYIADVLVRIGEHPASAIDDLLPDRWKPPIS